MVTGNTKQVVTKDADTTVVVYGYGSTNKPFYKEAKRVKANSDRWFLILDTPVPCGQKLLLISVTRWSFCTKASERVYITAEGCEIEFGETRGL